jgi:hypothetical protein
MTMDSLTTAAAVRTPMPSLQTIPRTVILMVTGMETTPMVIQEINSIINQPNGKIQMATDMEIIKHWVRSNQTDAQAHMETLQWTDLDAQIQMEMDILMPHLVTLPTLTVKRIATLVT